MVAALRGRPLDECAEWGVPPPAGSLVAGLWRPQDAGDQRRGGGAFGSVEAPDDLAGVGADLVKGGSVFSDGCIEQRVERRESLADLVDELVGRCFEVAVTAVWAVHAVSFRAGSSYGVRRSSWRRRSAISFSNSMMR